LWGFRQQRAAHRRIRKGNADANFSILRRIALMLLENEKSRPVLGEDLGGGDVEGADVWESEANEPLLAGEDCGAGGGNWGELWIPNGPRCSMSDEITVRQADAYWVSPADAYLVAGR